MINQQKYASIFLLVLALFDQIIALLFPVDFTYTALSFVPQLCFCGAMLIFSNQKIVNRILYSCLCGICVGMFFDSQIMYHMITYTLFSFLVGFFSEMMQEDHRIQFFVIWLALFIKDFLSFGVLKIAGYLTMSLGMWLIHVEFLTLIIHSLAIALMIYILTVFDRYATIKELRYRRMEKWKMQNIRRK